LLDIANGVVLATYGDKGDLSGCIQDVSSTYDDTVVALGDYNALDLEMYVASLSEFATLEADIHQALANCPQFNDAEWLILDDAAWCLNNPENFNMDVGTDVSIGTFNMNSYVTAASDKWDVQDYEGFGKYFGNVLMGAYFLSPSPYAEVIDPNAKVVTFTSPSVVQIAQIVDGVLKGALKAENAEDLLTCLGDTERTIEDLNQAYQDLSKRTFAGTADGLADLGHALEDLGHALEDCKSVTTLWSTITNWAHTFTNPISFAYHVGKDVLVNGSSIYNDIEGAISSWEAGQYEQFGEDVGDALAKVIVGMEDMYVIQ